jgi:hypothetical protein
LDEKEKTVAYFEALKKYQSEWENINQDHHIGIIRERE